MKATRHRPQDAPNTLHGARYRIEFESREAADACRRAVRMQPDGDAWIASAMDMYWVAEKAGELGELVPAEVLEEVEHLRLKSAAHILNRDRAMDRLGINLYRFQADGADFLTTSRDALLADEMGLGKTVQALMALPQQARGIVVAPRSLVLGWVREAATWRPDLKFTPVDREGLTGVGPGEFLVATPDAVRVHHGRAGIPFNTGATMEGSVVILDEAHLYKNPTSKRTDAIQRLTTHYDIRWALTGTPLANKPVDLWGTLSSIGLSMRMFGSRAEFDRIFGGVKDKFGAYMWPRKARDPDALRNAFRGRSLRRLRRDVAPQIPAKTYAVIHHDSPPKLDPEERAACRRFLEGSLDEKFGEPVAAVQRKLAESKIPLMFDAVDRFAESGDALVVFSANVGPLESLAAKYGCPLIVGATSMPDRAKAVDDFQSGAIKLIGLQIKAGGVGITLTAAHHMLFVQRDWSAADSDQAEDRICRLGQKLPCVIYDLLSTHPLDLIIKAVLASKARLMADTAGAIPTEASPHAVRT